MFIVVNYTQTQSIAAVQNAFRVTFPGRNPPAKSTVLRNVRKYLITGTSLNRNKGNSGRRRDVIARRNPVAISSAGFNGITRLDIRWHRIECMWDTRYWQMTCHVDYVFLNGSSSTVKTAILWQIL